MQKTTYKQRADRIVQERVDRMQLVEYEFERFFDRKLPLGQRIRAFLRGGTQAGRTVGLILDLVLLPFAGARTARALAQQVLKRKEEPMLRKILSVRGFVKLRDEDGNFSWSELAASALQLALTVLLVYVLTELGLWDQFIEISGDVE